jgi:hypothetical protein
MFRQPRGNRLLPLWLAGTLVRIKLASQVLRSPYSVTIKSGKSEEFPLTLGAGRHSRDLASKLYDDEFALCHISLSFTTDCFGPNSAAIRLIKSPREGVSALSVTGISPSVNT